MAKTVAQIAREVLGIDKPRVDDMRMGGRVPTSSKQLQPLSQIFDEEERRRALDQKQRYYNELRQQANTNAFNAAGMNNTARGMASSSGGYAVLGQHTTYKPPPPTQEEEEAWSVPIFTLCDMWEMRFGEAWVSQADIEKNILVYELGAKRLHSVLKLERRERDHDGVSYRLIK